MGIAEGGKRGSGSGIDISTTTSVGFPPTRTKKKKKKNTRVTLTWKRCLSSSRLEQDMHAELFAAPPTGNRSGAARLILDCHRIDQLMGRAERAEESGFGFRRRR